MQDQGDDRDRLFLSQELLPVCGPVVTDDPERHVFLDGGLIFHAEECHMDLLFLPVFGDIAFLFVENVIVGLVL